MPDDQVASGVQDVPQGRKVEHRMLSLWYNPEGSGNVQLMPRIVLSAQSYAPDGGGTDQAVGVFVVAGHDAISLANAKGEAGFEEAVLQAVSLLETFPDVVELTYGHDVLAAAMAHLVAVQVRGTVK